MSRLYLPAALTLGLVLSGTAGVFHAQVHAGDLAPGAQFGVIKGPSFEQAKAQTLDFLKDSKADAATLAKVEGLWDPTAERGLLDRVAESIALADADARALLSATRAPSAPGEVPEYLKDAKRPAFVRANLGLYFAKQLTTRRVNDEALEVLRATRPEAVVDPASYYFFKAVAENRLLHKEEGLQSIDRLLNSVYDVPERYTVLAGLMKQEMQGWKDKDLGYVARRMEEVEGRLDNARGGPKTQAKQKEIIDLLEKEIKDLEAQCQACMAAANANAPKSSSPLPESRIVGGAGPGQVEKKRLLKSLEVWGKMPEKERIKAYESIKRDLPPYYQEAIEGYLKELARSEKK